MSKPAKATVGSSVRLYYVGHWGFVDHEVRAVLDEDEQVVRRYLHPDKQWWIFECVSFAQHERDMRRDGLTPEQEQAADEARRERRR